jgi:hypothetical protein
MRSRNVKEWEDRGHEVLAGLIEDIQAKLLAVYSLHPPCGTCSLRTRQTVVGMCSELLFA